MQLFTDLAEFERVTAGKPRWARAAQAIRAAPARREGVMHSIGDSLTYLRTRRRHETGHFTGRRRYVEVIAAGEAPVRLEIAAKAELVGRTEYSDLSDREQLAGSGQELTLRPGEIVVVEIDEAVRYPEPAAEPCTVLHVSVEGTTFPNK
ncbi:hypothetical protein CFK38_17015 [Brachybacterium vulturis]|uniref:Beta-galactosidase subunit beta n=1 Tax=Brachybacterium vulturis TaxID=2017484 RepID=A0A291GS56_9MICO|nr:hypothetical protein [Brachybacterium vulturis]ATG53027.1 hypothetical protein CFK38_17015 [Brachybacterium vulturis]